jgi:hypothetical protein
MARRTKETASFGSFLIELAVYAVFVFAYFLLVLHFLGNWVKHLFDQDRTLYATIALALIVFQGIILEMLTTALLKLIKRRER